MNPSPLETIPEIVKEQFASAQAQVARQYPDEGDPYTVKVDDFLWLEQLGLFKCGKVEGVQGCFKPPNQIKYMKGSAGALWHDSIHAILYTLGSDFWRCCASGHEKYGEC